MSHGEDTMVQLAPSIKKVLIFGSSGFIGGRLAERLFIVHGHPARCLARDFSKLSRLARFPVEIVHGDVLQPEGLLRVAEGCDVFVFSVHGKDRDPRVSWRVNTEGLKNALELAKKNRAKHFIFLSTTAVFDGLASEGVYDETVSPRAPKKDYAGGKLAGEQICLEYSRSHGLPVTILRPTIVYGPFAPSFTIYPAELVSRGNLKDYGCFDGICNPLFVDDLVDVIITCMVNPNSYGQTYNVSSGETLSWLEFFNAFSHAINGTNLARVSRMQYLAQTIPFRLLKEIAKLGLRITPNLAKSIYRFLRSGGGGDWAWVKGQDVSTIKTGFYRKKQVFPIDKLRKELPYQPVYDFKKGFSFTKEWLIHHRYAPPSLT